MINKIYNSFRPESAKSSLVSKKKRVFKFFLKLAVSAGLVVWIIFKVNWSEVLIYVKELMVWQILLYASIFIIGVVISSYKWKLLAETKDIRLPLWSYFKFYLTGAFINNFMPSFIGGDTYRSYQTGKASNDRYIEAASTVLADRITGFIGAVILAVGFSIINAKTVLNNPLLIIINVLLVASFATDIIILGIRKLPVWPTIKKYIPGIILRVAREIKSFDRHSSVLKKAIFWGVIFNVVGVGIENYILFYALGIKIGLINYCTVIFLISIVSALPISINNIGIKEWAYITFFGIFGIGASAVVTVAIISRFLQMIITFAALPIYLRNK
ncbi:MAG: lysylphosphatidylglycerol synthase transmembrane domain-containing protein [Candidatus Moranbacteria bacterium]|nr:lysylphosphatidylglycerol synthase transmembrane domain-containing protein [Candidatus Moranbacteria bacterium]